jgi:uncharacterized protein (DUF58 family)
MRAARWLRDAWRRVRAWRRVTFTLGGLVFTLGTLAVGFAAMNTGNNLLYLLLGAMLGFIAVSGWMSEQAIRCLSLERELPRAVTVGQELRIRYRVSNGPSKVPAVAVEIREEGLPGTAFVAHVPIGGHARARSQNAFVRRGTYRLSTVTLSTAFPFGLFRKERDLTAPAEIIVWPRADRPVPAPATGSGRRAVTGSTVRGAAGHRGEYRSLRTYRPGDDPRDIHWRSSARLRDPVIREYDRDGAETRWICLDLRGDPGRDAGEVAIEVAASLAADATAEGRPFALVAGEHLVPPGEGTSQLELVLDALARVDVEPDAPFPTPPVDPGTCVLVSVEGAVGFANALVVGPDAALDGVESGA